jgi:nucleoside 2-deoxyribosyltransferase
MIRRFYLATRKDRESQANKISEALQARGWQRTFIWEAKDSASADEYSATAKSELDAIRNCDALIVLLPGGYGTHVEIGAALALAKPVVIHAPDQKTLETPYPCVFHYHPGVTLIVSNVVDVDAILTRLQ